MDCSICLCDDAAYLLQCGHSFHWECLEAQLRCGQNDLVSTGAISFNCLACPICRKTMFSKRLKRNEIYRLLVDLKNETDRLALETLPDVLAEVLPDDPKRDVTFQKMGEEEKVDFAYRKMTFYQCCTCDKPYFGGLRSCAEEMEGAAAAAAAAADVVVEESSLNASIDEIVKKVEEQIEKKEEEDDEEAEVKVEEEIQEYVREVSDIILQENVALIEEIQEEDPVVLHHEKPKSNWSFSLWNVVRNFFGGSCDQRLPMGLSEEEEENSREPLLQQKIEEEPIVDQGFCLESLFDEGDEPEELQLEVVEEGPVVERKLNGRPKNAGKKKRVRNGWARKNCLPEVVQRIRVPSPPPQQPKEEEKIVLPSKEAEKEEQVEKHKKECLKCATAVKICDHPSDFMTYKCMLCCSPATYYCLGTEFYCNPCHSSLSTIKPCPGPDKCPLKIEHPPNALGTHGGGPAQRPFLLSCSVCGPRNSSWEGELGNFKVQYG